eukprot:746864-Hanusia_phi.AAC.7
MSPKMIRLEDYDDEEEFLLAGGNVEEAKKKKEWGLSYFASEKKETEDDEEEKLAKQKQSKEELRKLHRDSERLLRERRCMIKPAQVKLRSKQELFEKINERVTQLTLQKSVACDSAETKVETKTSVLNAVEPAPNNSSIANDDEDDDDLDMIVIKKESDDSSNQVEDSAMPLDPGQLTTVKKTKNVQPKISPVSPPSAVKKRNQLRTLLLQKSVEDSLHYKQIKAKIEESKLPEPFEGIEKDFFAATTFLGSKTGYVFQMGNEGLGYYRDSKFKLKQKETELDLLNYMTKEGLQEKESQVNDEAVPEVNHKDRPEVDDQCNEGHVATIFEDETQSQTEDLPQEQKVTRPRVYGKVGFEQLRQREANPTQNESLGSNAGIASEAAEAKKDSAKAVWRTPELDSDDGSDGDQEDNDDAEESSAASSESEAEEDEEEEEDIEEDEETKEPVKKGLNDIASMKKQSGLRIGTLDAGYLRNEDQVLGFYDDVQVAKEDLEEGIDLMDTDGEDAEEEEEDSEEERRVAEGFIEDAKYAVQDIDPQGLRDFHQQVQDDDEQKQTDKILDVIRGESRRRKAMAQGEQWIPNRAARMRNMMNDEGDLANLLGEMGGVGEDEQEQIDFQVQAIRVKERVERLKWIQEKRALDAAKELEPEAEEKENAAAKAAPTMRRSFSTGPALSAFTRQLSKAEHNVGEPSRPNRTMMKRSKSLLGAQQPGNAKETGAIPMSKNFFFDRRQKADTNAQADPVVEQQVPSKRPAASEGFFPVKSKTPRTLSRQKSVLLQALDGH